MGHGDRELSWLPSTLESLAAAGNSRRHRVSWSCWRSLFFRFEVVGFYYHLLGLSRPQLSVRVRPFDNSRFLGISMGNFRDPLILIFFQFGSGLRVRQVPSVPVDLKSALVRSI